MDICYRINWLHLEFTHYRNGDIDIEPYRAFDHCIDIEKTWFIHYCIIVQFVNSYHDRLPSIRYRMTYLSTEPNAQFHWYEILGVP